MYNGKDPLNSHLQNHLSNKPNLQCEECGKLYNTRLGYRRHVATHAVSATGVDLTCKVCRQRFENMPLLLEHLSIHSSQLPSNSTTIMVRERKHPCDHCDRRFYTRKDVRRHAVVHTGRRDFLCPHCAQRFGRRDHLTRHLKKSHAQEPCQLAAIGSSHDASSTSLKEETDSTVGTIVFSKEPMDNFSVNLYNSQNLHSASSSVVSHQPPLVPATFSAPLAFGSSVESPKFQHLQQQQYYLETPRYQSASTSYLKAEMENLLAELQCGPPAPQAAASAQSSRQGDICPDGMGPDPHFSLRNAAFSNSESTTAANMDLSHLLGFLPFGFPPYNSPLSTGGMVINYSTTANTPAVLASTSQQVSGPLPSHLAQEPLASSPQLPTVFPPPGVSPHSLPHFHQASH